MTEAIFHIPHAQGGAGTARAGHAIRGPKAQLLGSYPPLIGLRLCLLCHEQFLPLFSFLGVAALKKNEYAPPRLLANVVLSAASCCYDKTSVTRAGATINSFFDSTVVFDKYFKRHGFLMQPKSFTPRTALLLIEQIRRWKKASR
jgi:hypothetical protein